MNDVKELVRTIACHLVEHPEAVQVKETSSKTASVIELAVPPEDTGRVIGRQGRTVEALRTILNSVGSRTKRKIVLEVVDTRKGSRATTRSAQDCSQPMLAKAS